VKGFEMLLNKKAPRILYHSLLGVEPLRDWRNI